MLIIDCIMTAYESDAIDVRLAELSAVVDHRHAVRGHITFQGDRLPPLPLPDAVRSNVVTLPIDRDPWGREKFLRNMSLWCATNRGYPDDSLYMVCDADEIPHPEAVLQAIREYPEVGPRTLRMDYREWYADWRAPDGWQSPNAHTNQPVIGTREDFLQVGGPHAARCAHPRDKWPYCDKVGWHLSNLGDPAWVSRKFGQFAHTEVQSWQRNESRLEKMRSRRMDATKRFRLEKTQDVPSSMKLFPHLMSTGH